MLRSRVYDVTLTHDDVIGPFFKVTFPVHLVDLIDDSIFLRGCEIGRTRPIIGFSVKHALRIYFIASEK